MRHSQCDLLLTCCTVILRFEDGRIKAQYPMDAAGAEKVKHFFTAKPDAQEEKELRQYRIILSADTASEVRQMLKPKAQIILDVLSRHFGNADAVPQLPERCLSRKAGIVRCCLNNFQKTTIIRE